MNNIEHLESKLIFYESYHHDFYNKLIHVVFVPLLLYTGIAIVNYYSEILAIIGSLFYSVYYCYLDLFGGISYSAIIYYMYQKREAYDFLTIVYFHIFSWIVQIFSHKNFEQRAPAFLDGIFTSLTIAPIYIWLELLSLVGYKKKFIKNIYNKGGEKSKEYFQSLKDKKK